MIYKNLNKEFLKRFAKFYKSYTYFFSENEIDETEWQYIFYEDYVSYILDYLLVMDENDKQTELLKRLFGFIETMWLSEENDVANLAEISFFEYRNDRWFDRAGN